MAAEKNRKIIADIHDRKANVVSPPSVAANHASTRAGLSRYFSFLFPVPRAFTARRPVNMAIPP
jgi:hypothetical protein